MNLVERPDSKRFRLFRSRDGVAFADIYGGATRQTWPVRSKLFAEWLSVVFFENERRFPTRTEVKSAITLIDGGGLRDLPVHDVFVRVGQLGDRLYLDLADDEWSAIEIDCVRMARRAEPAGSVRAHARHAGIAGAGGRRLDTRCYGRS